MKQIDTLISKYYTRWYVYARYLCNQYNIPGEAYDLFMESLTQFLSKTDGTIERLVEKEQEEERILLNYVKVIIKYNVINFYYKEHTALTLVPDISVFENLISQRDEPDQNINEEDYKLIREVEAQFRDDTFSGTIPLTFLPAEAKSLKMQSTVYRSLPNINGGSLLIPYTGRVTYLHDQKRKSKQKKFPTKEEAKIWIENFKYELVSKTV